MSTKIAYNKSLKKISFIKR